MISFISIFLFFIKSNVLVIGDSITAWPNNYVDILQDSTCFNYTKAGYGGRSSVYIKHELKKFNMKKFDKIIIEAGINNLENADVVIYDLAEMLQFAKCENPNIQTIILTITPYKGLKSWSEAKQKNLEEINRWILSRPPNLDVAVDVYTPLSDEDRLKYPIRYKDKETGKNIVDRIHPNKKGHEIMALEIMRYL